MSGDPRPAGRAAGGTRAWPIAGTVVGAALMIAALAVMIAAGLHASQLGDDPGWSFDCNDTTCVDLWTDARRHYLVTTGFAMVAGLAGWVLVGALRPIGPHGAGLEAPGPVGAGSQETGQRGVEPGPRRLVSAALGMLAVILWPTFLQLGVLPLMAVSRPAVAAGIGVAGTLATLMLWWDLRDRSGEDRISWFWAGMVMVCGAVGVAVGTLGGWAAVLAASVAGVALDVTRAGWFELLVPLLFLAGIPVGITAMVLVGRSIWARDDHAAPTIEAADPIDDHGHRTVAATPAREPRRTRRHRRLQGMLAAAPLVLLIAVLAVWAARPVDALPADAWRYGAGPGHDGGVPAPEGPSAAESQVPSGSTDGSAAPGTDSGGGPGPDSECTPTPVDVPADVPDCRADQLALRIGGWDGVTGNSYAVLRAHSTSDAPCALRGRPELVITQGGDPIDLRHEPLSGEEHLQDPALGAVLAPGGTVIAPLFWPGYRTAADQETPQSAEVVLEGGTDPVPVMLEQAAEHGIGPAPFDLKDGVEGGAEIQVGVWTPVR